MAPSIVSKRSRTQTIENDNDAASIIDSESASSAFRANNHKRIRLSTEDRASRFSTVDPGARSPTFEPTDNPHGPAEYDEHDFETRRDGEFEDLQFEEADDVRATQIVQDRFNEHQENEAAENAIVEEIRCENFMCHSKLTVKLGPLINFIIGHNGSGKSAVLTALTLCLGGKATSTNRGQNLKAFIKEGEESAMLSVRLKNQGSSAYMPDEYGESIIVERHFSRSGTSGFKLKNANGKIISTRKADLEDITDAFALQIDNPMNVLTQDMARQFLNSSTPSDKYKFFMKGTQLEQLTHDYALLEESVERTDIQLERALTNLDAHKKAYNEAQKKLTASEHQEILKADLRRLHTQLGWVQVAEKEEHRERLQQQLVQSKQRIEQCESHIARSTEEYETAERELNGAKGNIATIEQSRQPLDRELADKKIECEDVENSLRDIMAQQRTLQDDIKSKKAEISTVKQQRSDQKAKIEAQSGGSLLRLRDAIKEADEESKRVTSEFHAHSAGFKDLDIKRKAAAESLPQLRARADAAKEDVNQAQKRLQEHKNKANDWTNGYDRTLLAVMKMITQETQWRSQPVGPIGRHVRLLEPQWSSIIERTFGPLLNAFAVTCKEDEAKLSGILRRARYHGTVYIVDDRALTNMEEPDENVKTILRILKFDNDRARNICIINSSIDQIALVPVRARALDFLQRNPPNVRIILAMHDTKRGQGHSFSRTGLGNQKVGYVDEWRGHVRMQTDAESQVNMMNERLGQAQQEFRDAKRLLDEAIQFLQQCEKSIEAHKKQNKQLLLKKQGLDEKVAQLKDELEEATPQTDTLDALGQTIGQLEAELQDNLKAMQESVGARTEFRDAQSNLTEQLNEIKARRSAIDKRIEQAKAEAHQVNAQRERVLREKNTAYAKHSEASADKEKLERLRREADEEIEDFTAQALESVGQRVDLAPGETHTRIEKKYERLEAELRRAERTLGASREELARRALEAKANKDRAQDNYETTSKHVQALKHSMMDRNDRWRKFRRFISSRARITFTYLLSERDFRGKLAIDSKNKLLDIQVEPDITKNSAKGRQTKTLSGGEKSFSTICLLLSLWDAMGSPIRCLDEFDVFMDNVNRDISMKMMIQAARRSVGRQFILITPQSMGNVAFADDVKIIKMGDPERGQTALPFN